MAKPGSSGAAAAPARQRTDSAEFPWEQLQPVIASHMKQRLELERHCRKTAFELTERARKAQLEERLLKKIVSRADVRRTEKLRRELQQATVKAVAQSARLLQRQGERHGKHNGFRDFFLPARPPVPSVPRFHRLSPAGNTALMEDWDVYADGIVLRNPPASLTSNSDGDLVQLDVTVVGGGGVGWYSAMLHLDYGIVAPSSGSFKSNLLCSGQGPFVMSAPETFCSNVTFCVPGRTQFYGQLSASAVLIRAGQTQPIMVGTTLLPPPNSIFFRELEGSSSQTYLASSIATASPEMVAMTPFDVQHGDIVIVTADLLIHTWAAYGAVANINLTGASPTGVLMQGLSWEIAAK